VDLRAKTGRGRFFLRLSQQLEAYMAATAGTVMPDFGALGLFFIFRGDEAMVFDKDFS
jgi:hypothetical protein